MGCGGGESKNERERKKGVGLLRWNEWFDGLRSCVRTCLYIKKFKRVKVVVVYGRCERV